MDRLLIEGGRPLRGVLTLSGSKNASLPLMAAACLADSPTTLFDAPSRLVDVETMLRVLTHCGCGVRMLPGEIQIQPDTFGPYEVPYDIVRKMRASIYMLAPLLARHGRARVSMPGGCAIGTRPIDLHLKGLEALGARIEVRGGYVEATAPRLRGAEIDLMGLNGTSLGASAQILMAATMATGTTVIRNAAREPELVTLANFLTEMGAQIDGAGTPTLVVQGVDRLDGVRFRVPTDRIEAGTYMAATIATRGEALLVGPRIEEMKSTIDVLRAIGGEVEEVNGGLAVCGTGELKPVDVETQPHPGFPTDMQAQVMALLAVANGESTVHETIYPDRFIHAAELNRMGADIRMGRGEAIINGVSRLTGAEVMASDLRASAALVIAGLMAEGETLINRIYHLDRGYDQLEGKLRQLGARVERLNDLTNPGDGVVTMAQIEAAREAQEDGVNETPMPASGSGGAS
jgi:UDP-N-acetylglucosamine 1-carboxyvinyltransferase